MPNLTVHRFSLEALSQIKHAIVTRYNRKQMIDLCERKIKELHNLDRTGEPTPPNTLAVQR